MPLSFGVTQDGILNPGIKYFFITNDTTETKNNNKACKYRNF